MFTFSLQKNFGSLIHIARLHPQDRSISSGSRSYALKCREVYLGIRQSGYYFSDSTWPVLSLDKETGFRPDKLYFCLLRSFFECRLVDWNKIELSASTVRKRYEGK
jgi:hypothetical protein